MSRTSTATTSTPTGCRASGLPVWAPRGADLDGLAFTPVDPGQSLNIEGLEVAAVGGRHAAIVPGQEVCANVGYVVAADGETVYHPGDALAVPDVTVTTLLVPMQASWLKTEEAIGFLRAVRPDRAVGIHDGQVNDGHETASTTGCPPRAAPTTTGSHPARHSARTVAGSPASASSGSSSRPRTSTPLSPSTATRSGCRSSSTSPATAASTC